MTQECTAPSEERRRLFWATQLCDVVSGQVCANEECGIPGIQRLSIFGGNDRSISNENWLRGLIYNILYTDGVPQNNACSPVYGNKGGHWSDSYRTTPGSSGTSIRALGSFASVAEAENALKFQLHTDLSRLIMYGVASKVNVDVAYGGRNMYNVNIEVKTKNGQLITLGLVGTETRGIIAF